MTQHKEKAAAILADHDGNEIETKPRSKEPLMKIVDAIVPQHTVKDWNGHAPSLMVTRISDGRTIRAESAIMDCLISADSSRRAVDRSKYTIEKVSA